MDRLHDDMIFAIFILLPMKSLLQCQTVCKLWYSIINTTCFNHLYRNLPTHKDLLIAYPRRGPRGDQFSSTLSLYDEEGFIPMKHIIGCPPGPKKPNPRDHILGCSNGVLCYYDYENIHFWNPFTRRSRVIPNLGYWWKTYHIRNQHYGFGYVETSREFKLVRMVSGFMVSGFDPYRLHLYSSSSNSWRRIHDIVRCEVPNYGLNSAITVKGNLHWSAIKTGFRKRTRIVLAFDLHEEVLREMAVPESCSNGDDGGCFVICNNSSGESLYGFGHSYSFPIRRHVLDIWVMNEYGVSSSWTKLYRLEGCYHDLRGPYMVNQDDQFMASATNGGLIVYDHRGRQVRRHSSPEDNLVLPAMTYKESLAWFEKTKITKSSPTLSSMKILSSWMVNLVETASKNKAFYFRNFVRLMLVSDFFGFGRYVNKRLSR